MNERARDVHYGRRGGAWADHAPCELVEQLATADKRRRALCSAEHYGMAGVRCRRDAGHDGPHRGHVMAVDAEVTWADDQLTLF